MKTTLWKKGTLDGICLVILVEVCPSELRILLLICVSPIVQGVGFVSLYLQYYLNLT